MVLKVSSPRLGGLSASDCVSDPEDKEVSDDDDDDRNHKHRRRGARSQSLERDSSEQVVGRPFRKRNKPFENSHPFRENEFQASESWTGRFGKRRPGSTAFPRGPPDLNPRIRPFSGDTGSGRGRGRESGSWNQRDPRFSSFDMASQMVQTGGIPPNLFAGRGAPNVSNAQSASWGAFGLIPGMPNGSVDALHPMGVQGTIRPAMNLPLNMGVSRQRCRDFEERGFCLRGDMCPMEHGVNRIVVDDVQSLSQFNLPVTIPSANQLATTTNAPSTSLVNSKVLHSKNSRPGIADDSWDLNMGAAGADLYDPDQPLWNHDGPDTSTALLGLCSPNIEENESYLNNADNEFPVKKSNTTVSSKSTSSSVWGRISNSNPKNSSYGREKLETGISGSDNADSGSKDNQDAVIGAQALVRYGKQTVSGDNGLHIVDSSSKLRNDTIHNFRKSSQKALRTVFVNGIPQKDNKKELLFSHFVKFGEVIDIYIPLNSEKAFVQFSKQEEAEAALRAPDAVMGNRFIKLRWANRDSIADDGSGTNTAVASQGVTITNKGKNSLQRVVSNINLPSASKASAPSSDHPKPVLTNGPKGPPPVQKKLETLEQLREELRKKQELLEQKRNSFRQELDKYEKQASGIKGDAAAEQAAKRHKVELAETAPTAGSMPPNHSAPAAASCAQNIADKNSSVENVPSNCQKTNMDTLQPKSTIPKQQIRPFLPSGVAFPINRYKLDNRPTAFKVLPPLPPGFSNVDVVKEHFSSFGEEPSVELEETETSNGLETSKNCLAHITFVTRSSAERAYVRGKCWQGHNLQLMWLTPKSSKSEHASRANSSSIPKGPLDNQSAVISPCKDSQEAGASGNEGAEDSERICDVEQSKRDEDSQLSGTSVTGRNASSENSG